MFVKHDLVQIRAAAFPTSMELLNESNWQDAIVLKPPFVAIIQNRGTKHPLLLAEALKEFAIVFVTGFDGESFWAVFGVERQERVLEPLALGKQVDILRPIDK